MTELAEDLYIADRLKIRECLMHYSEKSKELLNDPKIKLDGETRNLMLAEIESARLIDLDLRQNWQLMNIENEHLVIKAIKSFLEYKQEQNQERVKQGFKITDKFDPKLYERIIRVLE